MTKPKQKKPVSPKIEENIEYSRKTLGIDVSFDVLLREFKVGRKKAAFIFIDGFANSELITLIMQTLMSAKQDDIVPNTFEKISSRFLPFGDISSEDDLDEALKQVLAGPVVFFIDGEQEVLLIDIREYPARQPEEPDIEKVTRGSRDGFVETLIFNVTLIRRRLRDPKLRVEAITIGSRSLTDVALVYIEDTVSGISGNAA